MNTMNIKLVETENTKHVRSDAYNYDFNKKSGFFARWGKTKQDDPQMGLPEIADIEITTKCTGPAGKLCKFCYKANTRNGHNMTIETYEKLLDKLHQTFIVIELENGTHLCINENDSVNTSRGSIQAKYLTDTDEIISI